MKKILTWSFALLALSMPVGVFGSWGDMPGMGMADSWSSMPGTGAIRQVAGGDGDDEIGRRMGRFMDSFMREMRERSDTASGARGDGYYGDYDRRYDRPRDAEEAYWRDRYYRDTWRYRQYDPWGMARGWGGGYGDPLLDPYYRQWGYADRDPYRYGDGYDGGRWGRPYYPEHGWGREDLWQGYGRRRYWEPGWRTPDISDPGWGYRNW